MKFASHTHTENVLRYRDPSDLIIDKVRLSTDFLRTFPELRTFTNLPHEIIRSFSGRCQTSPEIQISSPIASALNSCLLEKVVLRPVNSLMFEKIY